MLQNEMTLSLQIFGCHEHFVALNLVSPESSLFLLEERNKRDARLRSDSTVTIVSRDPLESGIHVSEKVMMGMT